MSVILPFPLSEDPEPADDNLSRLVENITSSNLYSLDKTLRVARTKTNFAVAACRVGRVRDKVVKMVWHVEALARQGNPYGL